MSLWLKADSGISLDPSSRVTGWADQSGNAHNAANVIANNSNPDFLSAGLNGQATLSFTNGQFLDISGAILSSQQFTIMAVVQDTRNSDDTDSREFLSNWSGTNTTT